MPNVPGRDPKPFQRGEALTARHLNQVLSALVRRIVGGTGILVKQTGQGSNIVISSTAGPTRRAQAGGTEAVLGEITTEVGAGVYTFKTFKGDGPSGEETQCKELNLSTGIGVGTRVLLHKAPSDVEGDPDIYWFFFPVVTCQ